MAYTNSPQQSVYKSVPILVDGRTVYRSGDANEEKDLQIWNMYYDTVFQDSQNRSAVKRLYKRPGLKATAYSLSKAAASDVIRGHFYDNDQNAFYWSVNDKVYSIQPDNGITVRTVATLATSTGLVGFCSFLKSDNTRYILISDGTDLWVDDYVAATCTEVIDADLPTPHEPSPIYIDGYVFLIKKDTGDIYNSDLDDPTSWTPGDFITAEISSDYLLRLVKSRNYIVALGRNSIEYFYDAGNASGSPLNRNDSPYRSVGYITGLCTIGDATYFVGQDEKYNVGVYAIDAFDVKKISNSVVDKTIQTFNSTDDSKSRALMDKTGCTIGVNGHTFYVVPTENTTWVYDLIEKEWYEWKNSDGDALDIEASWVMYNGSMYLAIGGQSNISIMAQSVYQDFDVNFTCRYTTEHIDVGTWNQKTCHRVIFNTSKSSGVLPSYLDLSWSDNDWRETTSSRQVNIFSQAPFVNRLGKFRRRSFRLEYTDNYPLWIHGFIMDITVGQH